MSSEAIIKVEGLGKCYHIYNKPRDRLLQMLMRGRKKLYKDFWALKGVSFEIGRGETVGIIGSNGSGKSTLLQMICGTLNPTVGTIKTEGRIAALLELGSGFNPEFSGHENVYLNAALLGLSKEETDLKYDAIVEFAGIGDFVHQPVKTYSSGMMVRLAFAVQAQVDPDILIVDEALAVGDARFQSKCFDRLRQLKENGTSILLVTHSSEQIVTHCDRAILLSEGQVIEAGEPRRVINRYMDVLFGRERIHEVAVVDDETGDSVSAASELTGLNTVQDVFSTRLNYNKHEYRWGDGSAHILDFMLATDSEHYPTGIETGRTLRLRYSVRFLDERIRPIVGITIKTKEGVTVYGTNSELLAVELPEGAGRKGSVLEVGAVFPCRLAPGDYFISLGIATRHGAEVVPHDRRYDAIHLHVLPNRSFFGLTDLGLSMRMETL